MMDTGTIRELANRAAKKAAKDKRTPYVPFNSDETRNPKWCRGVPNFGEYRPKGFTLVGAWLTDSSGFGSPGEAALTIEQLCAKAGPLADSAIRYGFALIEQSQFQILIGVFVPDEDLKAWDASDEKPGFVGCWSGMRDEVETEAHEKAQKPVKASKKKAPAKKPNPEIEGEAWDVVDNSDTGRYLVFTSPSFQCGLGDDDEGHEQLAVLFEIVPETDDDGEPTERSIMEASLVLRGKDTMETLERHGYAGGVPITHVLMYEVKAVGNGVGSWQATAAIDDQSHLQRLFEKAGVEAKIRIIRNNFGTVAAQRGRGARMAFPAFKSDDDAEKFCRSLAPNVGTIMGLIGFLLDRPVNMMGSSGWKTLEAHKKHTAN